MTVARIIARLVPWPDLRIKPNREGLRQRWDAWSEDGWLLAAATEFPLLDGAHALLTVHGLAADALVTLRLDGAAQDSFLPMPLRIPARQGADRAAGRERLAALRAPHPKHSPASGAAAGSVPEDRLRACPSEAQGAAP